MDSFAAFMYLFGMSGVTKIVLSGWRIVFVIDVQKGIHYLVLLIFFSLGELGSVHITRFYLILLKRDPLSPSGPSSLQVGMAARAQRLLPVSNF